MNNTQVVIAVAYTVAVAIAGVASALVLRSTREKRRGAVDEARLSRLEGRYGVLVVGFLLVLLFATIFSVPYGKTNADEGAQIVRVTAQQYGWAVQPSTIQANRAVDFRLVSKDVQHGFGVYDGNKLVFQVQVPAKDQPEQRYVTSFDEPGTYEINCLEFCGFQHHAMRGTLKVE